MADRPTSGRSFSPALILVALIAAVAIVLFVRSRGAEPAPAVATPETQADAAPPPVATRSSSRPAPQSPLEASRLMRERNAKSRKEMHDTIVRTQDTFSRRYASESVDPAWAAPKEAALDRLSMSETIEQAGAVPSNVTVDCKSSMCLVSADFPNRGDADAWFALYMNNVAAEVPYAVSQYVPSPDGGVTLKVYAVGRK
jgi:hypothetical protein